MVVDDCNFNSFDFFLMFNDFQKQKVLGNPISQSHCNEETWNVFVFILKLKALTIVFFDIKISTLSCVWQLITESTLSLSKNTQIF